MSMINSNVDQSTYWDNQVSNAQEEKIFVSIRLRPLNEKELANNDISDWECINTTTILYKNSLPERSTLPTAYTFDRVFGSDCSTRQVYEEAAKRVAVSVVNGINSSIFAYGQTSSGKTYTMCGITEYTVADIYDYIHKHTNREFVLKFSAMEIYNEAVRDLLSSDATPLRLLDDPERGTVVENIKEVTLRDWSHLKHLLSVCEAQRKIGETSLNEMSSRSHQILRLTVGSSAREFKRSENSSTLAATVNFVDLAGSERASQTLSAGTRLKEGCHINRSLLTLGTVIRKLSKGKNGHVPYRDSKLTRILQNSLGGNARTAIICTMSPAHGHVEQSRNTLLFASCAKQVSTNAHVNVVMSEKALVKQLQRELARLESQLKNLGSLSNSCDPLALKEKELLIEKMGKEIKELTQQRDQARSHLQNLIQSAGEYQVSEPWEKNTLHDECSASEASEIIDPLRLDVVSSISQFCDRSEGLTFNKYEEEFPDPSEEQFLSDDTSPRMFIEKYFGPDPTQGWEKIAEIIDLSNEDNCKEVQCIEIDSTRNLNLDTLSSLGKTNQELENDGIHHVNNTLKPTVEELRTIESPVDSHSMEQYPSSSDSELSDSRSTDDSRSRSCREVLTTMLLSPRSEIAKEDDTPSIAFEGKLLWSTPIADGKNLHREHSQESFKSNSTNGNEETIKELGLDDVVIKSEKQLGNGLVLAAETTFNKLGKDTNHVLDGACDSQKPLSDWSMEFEKQRAEIIQLWDACNISLVHRTYFYLVFRGAPSDSIYMEVELRRLSFLKVSQGNKTANNGQSPSMRAMNHERQMLSKLMLKRLSTKEREALFQKWGIGLKTKKRRIQLCRRLWTDTKDMDHINESAALVAKLVGIVELSHIPKEIVGLSFSTPQGNIRPFSWKHSMPSLV